MLFNKIWSLFIMIYIVNYIDIVNFLYIYFLNFYKVMLFIYTFIELE